MGTVRTCTGSSVPVHVHCTVLPWYSNTCTVDEGIIGNSNTIMLGKWYYAVIPQKWNYAPENAGIMRSGQVRDADVQNRFAFVVEVRRSQVAFALTLVVLL